MSTNSVEVVREPRRFLSIVGIQSRNGEFRAEDAAYLPSFVEKNAILPVECLGWAEDGSRWLLCSVPNSKWVVWLQDRWINTTMLNPE